MTAPTAKIACGAQIRAARALLGWKQTDLAREAGLHENAVAYHERADGVREGYGPRRIRAALAKAGAEITTDGVRVVSVTGR